jgi:hypothetical protein
MYGLVNKAIEDMVCNRFGVESWKQISERADTGIEMFVSMESYPDEITYKLVQATAEELKQPQEQVLEWLGEHWTLYTATEGYGEMLDLFGSNLKEFLLNLNNLHSRVGLIFPDLRPPFFKTEEVPGEKTLLLHYHSERKGLAPMVVGLLKGLARRFKEDVAIMQIANRSDTQHDIFRIEFVR